MSKPFTAQGIFLAARLVLGGTVMKEFVTQTNEKKVAAYNIAIFATMIIPVWLALIVYSLLQDPIDLYILGIGSACFGLITIVLLTQVRINNVFTLRFEGNVLYLDGKTKKTHYQVCDIPASDVVLTQSKADKAANRCSFRIKNTIFNLKYVENYSELKKYIEANYPTIRS